MLTAPFVICVVCSATTPSTAQPPAPVLAGDPKQVLSDSILWGYVPDLTASLGRLEQSPWMGLAPGPLAQSDRAPCAADAAAFLWGWGPSIGPSSSPPQSPDSAPLRWCGGVALEPGALPAPVPLHLQGQSPPDLVSRLDVQRAYGWLADQPGGVRRLRVLRRLGFGRAAHVTVSVHLDGATGGHARADVGLPPSGHGVTAGLGPPVPVQRPVWLARRAEAFVTASVIPSRMWLAAERVAAGLWPVEHSLWLLQLEGLQKQLNKSFLSEVLGDAPRQWTAVALSSRERRGISLGDVALVLEVADGAAARRFVEAVLGVALAVAPELEAAEKKLAEAAVLVLRGARGRGGGHWQTCIAFLAHHVIVAPTEAALAQPIRALMRATQQPGSVPAGSAASELGGPRAIAFAEARPRSAGRARTFVRALLATFLPGAGKRGDGRSARDTPEIGGSWRFTSQLAKAPGGYRVTARLRSR